MHTIAERVGAVKPFLAMEVQDRSKEMERAGEHIIHMEVGEPDFDTPPAIVQAMKEALDAGYTHYTHSLGDYDLRLAISEHYRKRYQVTVSPDQILVCCGTSPLMMVLYQALLNPGDTVLLPDPCYACYPGFVGFAGGVPHHIPTSEADGFRFNPADVRAALTRIPAKALCINSPGNPTGIVMEPERMQALADLGPLVISDEIYHGLTYGQAEEHSILEYTDNAVVIGGFSKVFAMTGWRLGYLITPPWLVRPLQILLQNFFLSPNAAIQRAGIVALSSPEVAADVERMRAAYDERRQLLLSTLRSMGFSIPVEPQGAFYALVNARSLNKNSVALAFDLLEKAHLGVTPGVDFGPQAEGFLRFSYATSLENIREGMQRLRRYMS